MMSQLYIKICFILSRCHNKLRIIHFRLLGIHIGQGCYIGKGTSMTGNIFIGDYTVIGDFTCLSTMPNGKISIGNDCHINSLTMIGSAENVNIEDHCIFAPYVQITDATHAIDHISVNIKNAEMPALPVHIGKNVWLRSGVVVLRGVVIGSGAMVGASSLVNKSIPENSVSVGSPAQVIRYRNI